MPDTVLPTPAHQRKLSKAKREHQRISEHKQHFLVAFKNKLGNVSLAAAAVGIGRATFYAWYNADAEFAAAVEEIRESHLDFAESKLLQKINDNDTTCLIFFLKTKGKSRGYVERQELDHSGAFNVTGITVNIMHTNARQTTEHQWHDGSGPELGE